MSKLIKSLIVIVFLILACYILDIFSIRAFLNKTFVEKHKLLEVLFSGVTSIGVIVTILLQRRDFITMTALTNKQRFEDLFFNMLKDQRDIYKSTQCLHSNANNYFYETYISILKTVKNVEVNQMKFSVLQAPDFPTIIACVEMHKQSYDNLQQYFLHLYRIIKFTDEEETISDTQKYNYLAILRSQMSNYELILLYYNPLIINDKQSRFRKLILKYHLFKHVDKKLFLTKNDDFFYSNNVHLEKPTDNNLNSPLL